MKKEHDTIGKSANPHDLSFKRVFKKPDIAEAFFRQYLPDRITSQIDFSTLKVADRSYVDEKLKSRHSDILYEVNLNDMPAFLYVLCEHQSTPDYWIIFRLLGYKLDIWRDFREQNPDAKRLPLILPVVVYHGKRRWKVPGSFSDIVESADGFEPFLPDFRYELYNLAEYEDDRIMLGSHMVLNLVLYLFKHIFDDDFADRFAHAAEYLAGIQDEQVQLEYLEWMLRYAYSARDDRKEVIDRGIEVIGKEKARRAAMTIAERLRQEGRQEGMQAGRQEGWQAGQLEGMQMGERNALAKLLRRRFHSLPPSIEQKILKSDIMLLEKFGDALFEFNSLRDVENWWEQYGPKGNA